MLLSCLGLSPASAQTVAAGRVYRAAGADSAAAPGVRVVLHEVGRAVQGPLDSAVTGPTGAFRFRFTPDTAALYLLSARYGGVEYFSPPVRAAGGADTGIALVVYDTSSTTPIGLAARHLVIPRAGEDGTREVLDLIVLRNAGRVARVAPDSTGASWSGPLPPASEGLEVGESDVSPEAVTRRGDSIYLAAPLAPGEKQLSLQYHLPAGETDVELPFGAEPGTVNVLVEEPGATVRGAGLALADTQVIGGRAFQRWTGRVPARAVIDVRLPGPPRAPVSVLGVLVAVLVSGLAVAAWKAASRRTAPAAATTTPAPLVDRIAALDARYLGREGEVESGEWAAYRDERARLKGELEALLGVSRPPP